MPIKRWRTRSGRVPGQGQSLDVMRIGPNDPDLLARVQLKDRIGVSNPRVITKALSRLGIEPTHIGSWRQHSYNNGGTNFHAAEVPRYPSSVVEQIKAELRASATELGGGRFSYDGESFGWVPPVAP